jgi:hypothetical protein
MVILGYGHYRGFVNNHPFPGDENKGVGGAKINADFSDKHIRFALSANYEFRQLADTNLRICQL